LTGSLPTPDNVFIVADSFLRNIFQVDTLGGSMHQLLPFGAAFFPTAVAYDATAKVIFWADAVYHTINRFSLLTNNSTVIYHDPANIGKYKT